MLSSYKGPEGKAIGNDGTKSRKKVRKNVHRHHSCW